MNNSNSRTIFTLVKFFREQTHLDDFLNGSLYMNTLVFFQNEEQDNESVYDKYESTSVHWQPDQIEMKFNEIVITPNDLAGPVIMQTKAFENYKIFCMYAINSGNFQELNDENYEQFIDTLRIDKENKNFGDFCVIVTDVKEFLNRVKNSVKKKNLSMNAKLVNYYDANSFNGSFNGIEAIFHKRSSYAHQNEYRIVVNNDISDNQAYRLEIGDIRDICSISSMDEINKAEWSFKKGKNGKNGDRLN